MITDRDAEAAGQKHREEKRDLKPVETEMLEVERDTGEGARISVPIRNELVIQLMRSRGKRKIDRFEASKTV